MISTEQEIQTQYKPEKKTKDIQSHKEVEK